MFFNNIYLDTFPVIPDSVGYIFLLASALYLSKLRVNGFTPALLSILGTALCGVRDMYRMHNSSYGVFSSYYWDYYKSDFAIPLDIVCAVVFMATIAVILSNVRTITSDNPDDLVFPSKILTLCMPVVALATTASDLLPVLEDSPLSEAIPDYYAIGSFIIPVCVLAVTGVCAAQLLKMRTDVQR